MLIIGLIFTACGTSKEELAAKEALLAKQKQDSIDEIDAADRELKKIAAESECMGLRAELAAAEDK